jgi:hypothetical protein
MPLRKMTSIFKPLLLLLLLAIITGTAERAEVILLKSGVEVGRITENFA